MSTPTKTITLPSLGQFYDGAIPGGKIEIRKMSINELSLLDQGAADQRVDEILKKCSVLPPGFKHSQLLSTDRIALLFEIRVFAFTADYNYSYKCPSCGTKNKVECNLSTDLKINTPKPEVVEPVSITLADAGVTVACRFLRGSDEEYIKQQQKRSVSSSIPFSVEACQIGCQIVTIDGETATPQAKEQLLFSLSAADAVRIKNRMDALDSGLDTTVTPSCKKCGETAELSLPMDREFFRPSSL